MTDVTGTGSFVVLRRPRPNAMEVFLLLLTSFQLVAVVTLDREPSSVEALLGDLWARVWVGTLFVAATTVLAGLYWRGTSLIGPTLQQVGYSALGIASLARAVALGDVGDGSGAGVVAAYGTCALFRVWQIQSRIPRTASPDRRRWRR